MKNKNVKHYKASENVNIVSLLSNDIYRMPMLNLKSLQVKIYLNNPEKQILLVSSTSAFFRNFHLKLIYYG